MKYDHLIDKLMDELGENPSMGDINYCVSSLLWVIWRRNKSYSLANNIVGVLECIKFEFYRRLLAPYEDKKIEDNGDL